ncbi:MAG: hypothetical protein K0R66_1129 [Gammaproteobacteria bacterium]|nr:hypothetical protein [Gammaproteobacteria bacterium]
MNKVHEYIEIFNKAKGDSLAKIKHILAKYSERWDWTGSDSVIADLLDDKNIAAEDIVAVMLSAVEMEEGNREFKSAATALDIALRKTHRPHSGGAIDFDDYDDFGGNDYQASGYNAGGYAEAS